MASIAALFAHVAVDVAGDTLLAHDTYDDDPHGSRLSIGLIGIVLSFVLLSFFVWRAWRETRGEPHALRDALAAASGSSTPLFALAVNAAAFALLAAMGLADAAAYGDRIESLQDALGGSWQLAAICATSVATPIALAIRAALALLVALSASIVAALATVLSCLVAAPRAGAFDASCERDRLVALRFPIVRGSAETRGPPALA